MKRNIKPEKWFEEMHKIQEELVKLYQVLDNPYVQENEINREILLLEKRRKYLITSKNIQVCKECGSIIYPYEFKELHVHRHKDLCVNCSRKYK